MRATLRISLLALSLIALFSLTACSASETAPVSGEDCSPEGAVEDGFRCQNGQWVEEEEELDAGHWEDAGGDDPDTGGDDPDTGSEDPDTGGEDPDADPPCEAETDEEFCTRHLVECGSFTARDDCGDERTVDCETHDGFQCPGHTECHLADDSDSDTNLCLCPPFDTLEPSDICELFNTECGRPDFQELCPEWDPVDDEFTCGGCDGNEECGEDLPNICGCPCEINGECYGPGDFDDDNVCAVCDPDESNDSFTDVEDGTECGTNSSCLSGECLCDDGFARCGDECVDFNSDVMHCGDCNQPCGSTTNAVGQCVSGECTLECEDPSLTYCESDTDLSSCADLESDDNNCGECGETCDDGETCKDGSCECADECCGQDDCGDFMYCCDGSCISNTMVCIDDPIGECTDDDQCKDGYGCKEGDCVCLSDCCADNDCSDAEQCCDGECISSTMICISDECSQDFNCEGTQVCVQGQCVCEDDCCSDSDCGETAQCCPDGKCYMGTVQCPIFE